MQQIIQQLLDLIVGALPTVLIVFLLFFFLRWAFWRPFERVLAQRQAATAGAREGAEELLKQADEKLHQYEEALRQGRAEIYQEQEASRRAALEARGRILQDTREQAGEKLRLARSQIAADVEQARRTLDAESERLAEEIARTLLTPAGRKAGKTQ
jgi:F0F1-type ATP synthase membrane subunit b/b'